MEINDLKSEKNIGPANLTLYVTDNIENGFSKDFNKYFVHIFKGKSSTLPF